MQRLEGAKRGCQNQDKCQNRDEDDKYDKDDVFSNSGTKLVLTELIMLNHHLHHCHHPHPGSDN